VSSTRRTPSAGHTETRILFEAEAQVGELGDQPAYVLAADGWHPGVIGIVASRIAERRHRPVLMIALDGAQGTGSGRSIPAFDLLGGLDACADHLLRHGGHRAAAGCTVARATPSSPCGRPSRRTRGGGPGAGGPGAGGARGRGGGR
jgi:single-stranded DNA-specific DHH superfamily exonuclease